MASWRWKYVWIQWVYIMHASLWFLNLATELYITINSLRTRALFDRIVTSGYRLHSIILSIWTHVVLDSYVNLMFARTSNVVRLFSASVRNAPVLHNWLLKSLGHFIIMFDLWPTTSITCSYWASSMAIEYFLIIGTWLAIAGNTLICVPQSIFASTILIRDFLFWDSVRWLLPVC